MLSQWGVCPLHRAPPSLHLSLLAGSSPSHQHLSPPPQWGAVISVHLILTHAPFIGAMSPAQGPPTLGEGIVLLNQLFPYTGLVDFTFIFGDQPSSVVPFGHHFSSTN